MKNSKILFVCLLLTKHCIYIHENIRNSNPQKLQPNKIEIQSNQKWDCPSVFFIEKVRKERLNYYSANVTILASTRNRKCQFFSSFVVDKKKEVSYNLKEAKLYMNSKSSTYVVMSDPVTVKRNGKKHTLTAKLQMKNPNLKKEEIIPQKTNVIKVQWFLYSQTKKDPFEIYLKK